VPSSQVDKLLEKNFIILSGEILWRDIINRLQAHKAEIVLVANSPYAKTAKDIIGVITPHEMTLVERETAELMSS